MSRPGTQSRPYSKGGALERVPKSRRGQRVFYSEYVGRSASRNLGNVNLGPRTSQSTVWKSQRDKHLPNVAKFNPPENFLSLLSSQVYGPTTQIITSDEFASRGWEPKTQVPYKVDSGSAPRKLEIERRKRHFTKHARDMDKLLRKNGVETSSDLMPVTDQTSRALLGKRGADGKTTPTFPAFLPLEVFDDIEYDCRTPQEWLQMGVEEDGVRKPVPGKALLPVLELPAPPPLSPTPPTTLPPPNRHTRQHKAAVGTKSHPLPSIPSRPSSGLTKSRYEWVDVGMLDYDPATKLYRVKRVYVPDHVLERNTAVATQRTEDGETEVWLVYVGRKVWIRTIHEWNCTKCGSMLRTTIHGLPAHSVHRADRRAQSVDSGNP